MDRMPSMDPNTSTQELADSMRLGSKPTWLHLTKKLPLKVAVHSQVTMETMMVLMRVVMKVEMMVKSLASTAHASVNMKTWLAGKSAMSASRLISVATMPTREMILTKEITEKMKVRSMAVNASKNATVSTMMKNVGKTAITAGRKFTQKTMKVKRVKAKTMVAMTWCASKSVNVTMTTKSVGA